MISIKSNILTKRLVNLNKLLVSNLRLNYSTKTNNDESWNEILSTLNFNENKSNSFRNLKPSDSLPPLVGKGRQLSNKNSNITKAESEIFEDILNLLFQQSSSNENGDSTEQNNLNKPNIKKFKRVKSSEQDKLLDEYREEIINCKTDLDLFNWSKVNLLRLDSTDPLLPYILSDLMMIFRDIYKNPHLSLALFNFIKSKNIYSYVLGCTTKCYNELIITRYFCFKDLLGVLNSLEEMLTNGVKRDKDTENLVENIRNDVLNHFDNEINENLANILIRMEILSTTKPLR